MEAFDVMMGPSRALFVLLGLLSLGSASCPQTIKTHISYGLSGGVQDLPSIYETLSSCPEIHSLDIKLSQGGCLAGIDPWNFKFSPGDRFPPLKTLCLDKYDFDETQDRWLQKIEADRRAWRRTRDYLADLTGISGLRPSQQPLEPPSASNLDKWKLAMDWTQLENLEIADINPRFLEKMTGDIPALKTLKLRKRWADTGEELAKKTTYFLERSPPLSMLSLHGYTGLVNWKSLLPRFSNSLKALEIREWESSDPSRPRPVLSYTQLEQIKEICPFLEEISLDINRNGTWPHQILGSLAKFENVQKLELWFELGVDLHQHESFYYEPSNTRNTSDEAYRQPLISKTAALDLFRQLRSQKHGRELQELVLYVGDWGRDYGGGMRFQGWGEGLEAKFTCSILHDGGQRNAEGVIWCGEE